MDLYREDGRKAGLYDVCDWWMDKYPSDIFVGLSPEIKEIVDIRLLMRKVLLRAKRAKPSYITSQKTPKQE